MKYIEIEKDLIPYRFEMVFNNNTYILEINYNNKFDFFTLDLYRDKEIIFLREKIVYAKPIFISKKYSKDIDAVIYPYDLSEKANRVTWDNLEETVFMYLICNE